MIDELWVRDLGVIADIDLRLLPGLTAITGETGAGKTLVVEALELVLGGRSDASLVRHGAEDATVEARFVVGESETIISRIISRAGRSRALLDGHMVPVASLGEIGQELVDLYGQHAHQSLLRSATQRSALDVFAKIDLEPVLALRNAARTLEERLGELGGDAGSRERELDIARFELAEIEAAAISSDDEEELLEAEEHLLATAEELRARATASYVALAGGDRGGAIDLVAQSASALGREDLLAAHAARLQALLLDLEDAAEELRRASERFEEDPERLVVVQERRQTLRRLVRKHGDSLKDVIASRTSLLERIAALESNDEQRAALEEERLAVRLHLAEAESVIGDARRAASVALARAVEERFVDLALERARLEVHVPDEGIGDEVEFLLAANPGEPFAPLAKVASGGELARVMLALRLVLSSAPATLVFDEVDAGIGGQAALAVGRALATLALEHQVLVVTHLAQVAAYADHHLVVEKAEEQGRTIAHLQEVIGEKRLIELSRMLSGHPDSEVARHHAAELLEGAAHLE